MTWNFIFKKTQYHSDQLLLWWYHYLFIYIRKSIEIGKENAKKY